MSNDCWKFIFVLQKWIKYIQIEHSSFQLQKHWKTLLTSIWNGSICCIYEQITHLMSKWLLEPLHNLAVLYWRRFHGSSWSLQYVCTLINQHFHTYFYILSILCGNSFFFFFRQLLFCLSGLTVSGLMGSAIWSEWSGCFNNFLWTVWIDGWTCNCWWRWRECFCVSMSGDGNGFNNSAQMHLG